MSEHALRDRIRETLEEMKQSGEPLHYLKLPGGVHMREGTPDWLIVYDSVPLLLEAKQPGEKPRKIQEYELSQWGAAGAVAGVICSINDLMEQLRRALKLKHVL